MDSQLDMQNTDTQIFIQTNLQFWNLVVGDVKSYIRLRVRKPYVTFWRDSISSI